MKVQFLNWECRDIEKTISKYEKESKFCIFGFGKTCNSEIILGKQINTENSLCFVFQDFKPYFYLRIDNYLDYSIDRINQKIKNDFETLDRKLRAKNKRMIDQDVLKEIFKSRINYSSRFIKEICLEKTQFVESSVFMGTGFENFKKYKFCKFYFTTKKAHDFFQKFFVKYSFQSSMVYEGNINPMIKFFHDINLQPSSWLNFDNNILSIKSETCIYTKANFEFNIPFGLFTKERVRVIHENNSLWFKLCSYDIECDSSHGDYPIAIKDYSKFKAELERVLKLLKFDKFYENEDDDFPMIREILDICDQINSCIFEETKLFSRIYLKKQDAKKISRNILKKWVIDLKKKNNFDEFHEFLKLVWGETIEGDPIIQIGNVIEFPKGTYKKVIFCLNETEMKKEEGNDSIEVYWYETEKELLIRWAKWVEMCDPDIIMGYNIYNFDNEYIWKRCYECECLDEVSKCISRIYSEKSELREMTKGTGKYIQMNGREIIDLMDYVKKNYSLDSYSLDNVAAKFIRGKITGIENLKKVFINKMPIGLKDNDFFKIFVNNGIYEEKYVDHINKKSKFLIKKVLPNCIELNDNYEINIGQDTFEQYIVEWCLSKDDISPKQIFEFQKGTKYQRFLIAKYCIQDCMLCHYIFQKLEVLINNMAMSNVCFVPFGFLFLRGQSVKIFSLISKQCADENYRIPVLNVNDDKEEESEIEQESYEGALVLEPKTGIYIDEPITVNDFNSLYPSCGIAENISPDTQILDEKFLNVPGYEYNYIQFDEFEYREVIGLNGKIKKNKEPFKIGTKTCVFVVYPNNEKGILPKIWSKLLNERKQVRKKMEKEEDPFKKTLLDGLQLAFKTSANSMYGIFGFSKSPLYYKDVAASITACGRKNLMFAKNYIETNYPGSKIIYGDTDSLFVSFGSQKPTELEKIYESIDTATGAGDKISDLLKSPHNLGFEKCISPFILMARKRYSGLYYTSKTPKKYMNTMGFVLKRRDNALIVKEIVGNAVKMILFEKNIAGSIEYVKRAIYEMLNGKYDIDKFVVTKTLKDSYSCPEQIAHYVLAQRMGERDPGNKPKNGERIPYVFIEVKKKLNEEIKQSDRIENLNYVLENHCGIDYMYYLTNQLMNPLMQVYSLLYRDKTEEIIFGEILRYIHQKRENLNPITKFYTFENEPKGKEPSIVEENPSKRPKKTNKHTIVNSCQKITSFFNK